MGITVSFSGDWDGAIARLEQAGTTLDEGMMGIVGDAVEVLRTAEAEYPDQPEYHLLGDNPAPFFSPKQKRYFFWALARGLIQVPYQRTGQLAAEWQTSVTNEGDGRVRGRVWNDSPIARLVMGDGTDQARMFRGVWQTAQRRYDGVRDEIINLLREGATRLMTGIFR